MSPAARVRDRMRPGAVAVAWNGGAHAPPPRMRAARLDAIPVLADDRRVIGLVERDAVRASRRGGNRLGAVPVADLMRRGVFVCREGDALGHALATMDRLEVDLLAVVDGTGRVVGVVGRDGEDDALPRLVPALYRSY